jgi:arylformamidase
MSTKLYADFETVDELERQFMFVDTVPDMWPYIAGYTTRSEEARSALTGTLDVPYGPTREEYVDIFPAAVSGAPIMIFFHGGAWRMLSAKDYSFVAPGLVAAGITTILVNHSLCPKVGVDEIVRQARAAVAWTFRNASSFGGDPGRIYVAGHSAGAQLTAMCAITAWSEDYGLPIDIIKGGVPISGIFDLTPLRYTSHQASLQLDGDIIARNSPCLLPVTADVPPLLFSMGSNEPSALMQQVRDQFSGMRAVRSCCELFEQPGLNHFQTVDGFESPDSELLNKVLAWMETIESG